jgi:hypothetical protein
MLWSSPLLVACQVVETVCLKSAVYQTPGESTPWVRNKYLAGDRVVTIIDGPVCAERVLFWKVQSQEIDFAGGGRGVIVGWVAEESGDIYLLEPK